jgi:hypothetical protein
VSLLPAIRLVEVATALARLRARRLPERGRRAALAALILLTSAAVGSAVSWWLVPGYLVLMGWLLGGPRPETAPSPDLEGFAPHVAGDCEIQPSTRAEAPGEPESPTPAATNDPTGATRRKRRRKAKARIPAAVGETATWVRVGPGKFIRVEGPAPPETPAATVPGDSPEVPNEPPAVENPADRADEPSPEASIAPEADPALTCSGSGAAEVERWESGIGCAGAFLRAGTAGEQHAEPGRIARRVRRDCAGPILRVARGARSARSSGNRAGYSGGRDARRRSATPSRRAGRSPSPRSRR